MEKSRFCGLGKGVLTHDPTNLTREKVAEIVKEKLSCWWNVGQNDEQDDSQSLSFLNLPPEERDQCFIANEMDFDSLDMLEWEMWVEQTFGIIFNKKEEQKLFDSPFGIQIDLIYAKTQEGGN